MIDKVDWDRLKGESHVGSRGLISSHCLLSPKGVDIFVQLRIDLRACAAIVMSVNMSISRRINRLVRGKPYRWGTLEKVVPKI